eukprot:360715-Amphidinium_carterae.2
MLGSVSRRVGGMVLSGPTTPVVAPRAVRGEVARGATPDAGSVDGWKGLGSSAAGPTDGSTGPVGGGACGIGSARTGMLVSVFQRPEKVWVTSVCTAVVTSGSTA